MYFDNILLNTDRQLLQGTVVIEYDPTMNNILDTGDVVEAVGELGEALGDIWDEIFKEKEKLLDELAQAVSFGEQQNIISQINAVEVTIAQQIDAIPGRENLSAELQQELEDLKKDGNIATTEELSPQEIEQIKSANALLTRDCIAWLSSLGIHVKLQIISYFESMAKLKVLWFS
ncbi:hypothetical protein HME9304_01289 [Flagellimonas maritima]|uniref:Uncharacterized protein n=1 Tax=Flagellimonas maritima TaxID=1383885 RepID=A0A2Z4LRE4_9FLAO|nr:hypothetical protein HME9304_01289 [Allomuricauda aurantiaca]